MKLISVQSRGDRLVNIKLLDGRFFPQRTNLFRVEFVTFVKNRIISAILSKIRRFKHERTA